MDIFSILYCSDGVRYKEEAVLHDLFADADRGEVDVEVDETQFALIPNVGDYVDFPGEDDIRHVPLKGKVKSRCFNYKLGYCYVTVVIEESDDDWSCIRP